MRLRWYVGLVLTISLLAALVAVVSRPRAIRPGAPRVPGESVGELAKSPLGLARPRAEVSVPGLEPLRERPPGGGEQQAGETGQPFWGSPSVASPQEDQRRQPPSPSTPPPTRPPPETPPVALPIEPVAQQAAGLPGDGMQATGIVSSGFLSAGAEGLATTASPPPVVSAGQGAASAPPSSGSEAKGPPSAPAISTMPVEAPPRFREVGVAIGEAVAIQATGEVTFPLTLSLRYDPLEPQAKGVPPELIRVFFFDESAGAAGSCDRSSSRPSAAWRMSVSPPSSRSNGRGRPAGSRAKRT